MRSAITIGRYLVPHSIASHDLMGADDDMERVRFLLDWLTHRGWDTFSATEVRRDISATRFPTTADVTETLDRLADLGWVRRLPDPERPSGHRGRPPAHRWQVHPKVLAEISKQSEIVGES
jgi:hypothetical protein